VFNTLFHQMPNIIVYTAVFGKYDSNLPKVTSQDDAIQYFCFTDHPFENSTNWQCIYTPPFFKDNKLNSSYLKTNAHLLFPSDSIVIWIDSNFEEFAHNSDDFYNMLQGRSIATLPHPERQTVLGEAAIVASDQLDYVNKVMAWEKELIALGYPDNAGLAETAFLIRDLRNVETHHFNQSWWQFLCQGSRRDQLSFNPALWYHKTSWTPIKVELKDGNRDDFLVIKRREHSNLSTRSIKQSHPAFSIKDFASTCWLEMHPVAKTSEHTSKLYFVDTTEYSMSDLLNQTRALNNFIQNSLDENLQDNYCFVEKQHIHQYSAPDIRFAWKRQALRKATLPSRLGIEIGFLYGHSSAIMLAHNPKLTLLSIDTLNTPLTQQCAAHLSEIYNKRLDIYAGKIRPTLKKISEEISIDNVEFLHFNTTEKNNIDHFEELLEWFLCHCPIGCRLICSDNVPEAEALIILLYGQGIIDNIDLGFPQTERNTHFIKLRNLTSDEYIGLKTKKQENEHTPELDLLKQRTFSLEIVNDELRQEKAGLENELKNAQQKIQLLSDYELALKKPVIGTLKLNLRLLLQLAKKIFRRG
jgi:hypothetical protein